MEQYVGLDVSLKLTAICIVEGCDTIIVADDGLKQGTGPRHLVS